MKRSIQKIALVTGANSGLGKEIAIGLAKAGVQVILVCRDMTRGSKALQEIIAVSGSSSIALLIADLSSQKSIRLLVNSIYERYSRLDILINNAGVVLTRKKLSPEHIEMTLATNYLGPFLLTNLLVDLLKKGASSRIINISSGIHYWATLDKDDLEYNIRKYKFLKVYAQSKLLVNLFTFELARKLQQFRITVNCVDPGPVRTNLGSKSANNLLLKAIDFMIKVLFTRPSKAAQPIVNLALSPEYQHVSGNYFAKNKKALPSRASCDDTLAKQVWTKSNQLIADINKDHQKQ